MSISIPALENTVVVFHTAMKYDMLNYDQIIMVGDLGLGFRVTNEFARSELFHNPEVLCILQ